MSQCKKCGAPVEDGEELCANCGAEAEETRDTPQDAPPPETQVQNAAEEVPSPEEDAQEADPTAQGTPEPSEPQAEESAGAEAPGALWNTPAEGAVTPEADDGGTPPPAKRSRTLPVIIGIVVVVVVILLICAANGLFGSGSSRGEDDLFGAWENTKEKMEDEWNEMLDVTGLSATSDSLKASGADQELAVSIPLSAAMSLDFSLVAQSNAAGDKGYVSLDAGFFGMSQRIVELSQAEKTMIIASPMLFEGTYSLNSDEARTGLADCALGRMMGVEEDAVASAFDAIDSYGSMVSDFGLTAQTNASLEQAWKNLKQSVEVKNNGQETVTVNGVDRDCTAYYVAFTNDQIKTYLNAVTTAMLQDENLRGYMEPTMLTSGMRSWEELLVETQDAIDEMMEQIEQIYFNGYVADGCLVKGRLTLVSDGIPLAIGIEIGGERNLTDAITLAMYEEDGTVWQIKHKGSLVPVNGVVSSEITLTTTSASTGLEEENMTMNLVWDTTKQSDNLSFSCEIPDALLFTLDGSLVVDNAISLAISHYSYGDYSTNSSKQGDLSITYHAQPGGEISEVTGAADARNLLTMSESELEALVMEIQNSAYSLAGMFGLY